MVHKPKHRVHSFRGLLGSGGQDEINLERQNVNLAYRIVKFQTISEDPASVNAEMVHKIYKTKQDSIDEKVYFSNPDLLAVSYGSEGSNNNPPLNIVFDNDIFSRNIFVTYFDDSGSNVAGNYYIELEEVPVTASTLMQLKLGVARKLNLTEVSG